MAKTSTQWLVFSSYTSGSSRSHSSQHRSLMSSWISAVSVHFIFYLLTMFLIQYIYWIISVLLLTKYFKNGRVWHECFWDLVHKYLGCLGWRFTCLSHRSCIILDIDFLSHKMRVSAGQVALTQFAYLDENTSFPRQLVGNSWCLSCHTVDWPPRWKG